MLLTSPWSDRDTVRVKWVYSKCTVSVQWVLLLSLHWHSACVLCVKYIPPEIARWHWLHYWPALWRPPFGQPVRICEEQCFLSRLHGTTIGMCVKLCPTCPTAFLMCACVWLTVTVACMSISMCPNKSSHINHAFEPQASKLWHPPARAANNVSLPMLKWSPAQARP